MAARQVKPTTRRTASRCMREAVELLWRLLPLAAEKGMVEFSRAEIWGFDEVTLAIVQTGRSAELGPIHGVGSNPFSDRRSLGPSCEMGRGCGDRYRSRQRLSTAAAH